MKQIRWIVFLLLALPAIAGADVVFTSDGREIAGQVTEADGVVTITQANGDVTEVPEDEVIYIVRRDEDGGNGSTDLPTDYAPPVMDELDNDEPTSEPAVDTSDESPRVITPPAVRFRLEDITRPDVIAFMYMRRIADAHGDNLVELDQTLQIWQGRAHDQARKVGNDWVTPNVFAARRENFEDLLDDATTLARELARIDDDDEDAEDTRAQLQRQLAAALLRAANSWADPEIRRFLQAVAYYQAEDYRSAARLFEQLRRDYPMVTAYHQGYGLSATMVSGQELDALSAFINALELEPESAAMLANLQEGLDNVPGSQTRDEIFQEALAVRERYRDSALETRPPANLTWVMPTSRGWLCRSGVLPLPSCDRIVYRQGWAIPVAADTLLVDREVTRDAGRVFIRIDEDTVVPAEVLRSNSLQSQLPMMAMIRTREAVFTPLQAIAEPNCSVGDGASFTALGLYTEMGTDPRHVATVVAEVLDGRPTVLMDALAAGESATAVTDSQGRLLGFLEGKTDYLATDGGEDAFIPISPDLGRQLVSLAQRRRNDSSRSIREPIEPIAVQGGGFQIFAIATETFDE
jgi:tetratricopeptide (TPR) repeat protein